MAGINYRRVAVLTMLVSLVLAYALLWGRMITTPVEYTGTDFVAFYTAARIAANEGPAHAYDVALEKAYEERMIGFEIAPEIVRIYLDPPFFIPLVSLVAVDHFVTSLILWNLLMAVFALPGTWLVFSLLRKVFARQEWPLLLVAIVLFFPMFKSQVIGQNSPVLYLGACAWLVGVLTERDWLAGLGLAVMTVRPHFVLPLALPFIFRRRKVWWWFLLGAASLALFSLAYSGLAGIEAFLHMLGTSASAVNATTGERSMNNLLGLMIRLLPAAPADVLRVIAWGVYLAGIAGLCWLWARTKILEKKHLGLAVIVTIFTAPHFHSHDLVLLMVPIVCLMLLAAEKQLMQPRDLTILLLAVSLVMLLSFSAPIFRDNLPYLIMLGLLLSLWFPERIFRRPSPGPLGVAA